MREEYPYHGYPSHKRKGCIRKYSYICLFIQRNLAGKSKSEGEVGCLMGWLGKKRRMKIN